MIHHALFRLTVEAGIQQLPNRSDHPSEAHRLGEKPIARIKRLTA
jgi:hypothetical protein